MNIVFTLIAAFPIGFLVRQRGLAITAYLAADALVFTYQTLSVLLDWLANNPPVAFGPSPTGFPVTYDTSQFVGYGVLNFVIVLAGTGLTMLGGAVARRRAARRAANTGHVAARDVS